jgi:glycosyltransferase involved in cell wall biosynthesis
MIHVLFINRRFEQGGAERQLIEILKGIDKNRFCVAVATFYEGGALANEMKAIEGLRWIPLRKWGRWDVLPFVWRLWQAGKGFRPQIIHGYMGVANHVALFLGQLLGAKVVWGIRSSDMDFRHYDWLSALSFRLERFLSRFVDLVLANSQTGGRYHVARGFPAERLVVVPNGIDVQRFHPDAEARARIRKEWDITGSEILIGLVARFDPMKDHPTFLRAVTRSTEDKLRFVCIGWGPDAYQSALRRLASELGVDDRIIWAGARQDMSEVYNGLDLLTLSSAFGEGFPNVVAEAMSCGTPCVVTNVGDSAWIVGDTGVVVPPKSPEALATGWSEMIKRLDAERSNLSERARSRIVDNFRRELLVERTSDALAALL